MTPPTASLSPLQAYQALMAFAAQRGEPALRLALHAALPQVLRPDLLHLLRLNFVAESLADLAVEADVLLAPFCENLGNGYYRFDSAVRLQLLQNLDPAYAAEQPPRSVRTASFLLSYYEQQERRSPLAQDRLHAEYLDVERWGALGFLNPEAAAAQLAAALQQATASNDVAARIRITGLTAALSTPLARYGRLLTLAAGLEALEAGEAERAQSLADSLGDEDIAIGSVKLQAPQRLLRRRLGLGRVTPAWSHARFEAQHSRIEQQLVAGQLREALTEARDLLERTRSAGEQAYPDADYDLALAHFMLARVLRTANAAEAALPLLDEARRRFETIAQQQASRGAERMASACLTERGDCLLDLGRLDAAAAAYEAAIHRAEQRGDERSIAVNQCQLGTVRLLQRDYPAALQAYAQARKRFMQLDEPGSVARVWHQTGMAYQEAGQLDAAEDAYRQALALKVRLGDVAGEASTLGQLGWLYDDMGRLEDAVSFTRWAAERHAASGDQAKEGMMQNNLAVYLRKLRRLDEARQAIRRALDCNAPYGHASEPWKTWDILAAIETDADQPAAAAEARAQAQTAFLAYRRAGGENHSPAGRLAAAVAQALRSDQPAAASALLQQNAAEYEATGDGAYLQALQALSNGSRDPRLAADPDLSYDMAAEILLLLEQMPAP